jgi:Raf kinase inhibitor-like YbhB/YbcL family protein
VRRRVALAAVIALVAPGCGGYGRAPEEEPTVAAPSGVRVTSAFEERAAVPKEFTCDGEDVSPPLKWTAVDGAREYALLVTDPDAPGGTFVHWVVFGIPASVQAADRGAPPAGSSEGTSSFGDVGYGGPCPPEGDDPHRYEFTVYALDAKVSDELEDRAGADEVAAAIECCVKVKGTLTGTYGR